MLNVPLPGQLPTTANIRSFYIREWARFIHNNLDKNPVDVNPEAGPFSNLFRAAWINNDDWTYLNLNEYNNGSGLKVSKL
jgi:hypothetical protein